MISDSSAECLDCCLTHDKVRVKLVGDGHDDLLEGIEVICITHALGRPRNIDVANIPSVNTASGNRRYEAAGNLLPYPVPQSNVLMVSVIS